MAFKSSGNRGAYFEKLKAMGMLPKEPGMTGIPKVPSVTMSSLPAAPKAPKAPAPGKAFGNTDQVNQNMVGNPKFQRFKKLKSSFGL